MGTVLSVVIPTSRCTLQSAHSGLLVQSLIGESPHHIIFATPHSKEGGMYLLFAARRGTGRTEGAGF